MDSNLKQNIIKIYGAEGRQWLDSLPDITAKIANEHNLSGLTPVNNMTFNYVASGYQNDNPIILKIGMNSKALTKEASCLKAFALASVAEVIADDTNMIIMQRAVPGSTLKEYFPDNDIDATKILCAKLKELHKASIPESHNFYHLSELFKTLDQKLDIPDEILTKAKRLRDDLLKSTTQEVLLHGDLHHDNILKNGDNWLVIDPKGFIGDPAFEPVAYLCNPIPELLQENQPREIIEKRINICSAELDIDSRRIADWLYAKSVLCWAWRLEDNLEPGYYLQFISMLTNIMEKGG
jgi:streptomycin 6-kinase